MAVQNNNDLQDLSPPTNEPKDPLPPGIPTDPPPLPDNNQELFTNPNPPPIIEKPTGRDFKNPIRRVPVWITFGVLILILVTIVGFTVNEVFFNRITALSIIPDDTEYYLTFSIKEHPQAKKAKELVSKLPAGDKMLESMDNYSSELFGPQDPFEDIVRLSNKEIFLAKLYPEGDQKQEDFGGVNDLLNIVDLNRPKNVREELEKFRKDPDVYEVSDQDYNRQNIMNIKLKEKSSSARQRLDLGPLPSKVTLPLSKGIFASQVKNFIVASENISDVRRSLDLAKVKSVFGLKNSELKSLQDEPSHKKLAAYFPKETLLKFYQNQPLSPYGDYLPTQSLGQSFIGGRGVVSNPKGRAETFVRVPKGLTVTAEDNGMYMTSYQLDIKNPDGPLNNPFKFEESLANRLPKKFSGIAPAFYGEAKNYYQVYKDQIEQIKDVADNSDNRNQREQFKKVLKYIDESKSDFRKAVGIDYEKDLLAYLDSHVATIFNAGGAKKSPEFLIVADIKDGKSVEKSLKKIRIPNYLKEYESKNQDYARKSDLIQIGTGVSTFLAANQKVPNKLADLVPTYLAKIPKDPETKKPYKYTPSSDLKSAQVEAKLNDGRTAYWSSITGSVRHEGVAKKITIPPLTPKSNPYKETTIHSLKLYEYEKFSLNMYFTATGNKLVILFSDTDQSLKEILDFKAKPEEALANGENWKTQFENKGDIGGFVYVEPIQFWGIVDYIQSIYPDYKRYLTTDLENAIKGYLKTLKSIGTVVSKEKEVHISKTYIQVVELPAEEKKKVEESVQRLLDADKNGGYRSVLGIETSTDTLELWKERIKRLFVSPTNQ